MGLQHSSAKHNSVAVEPCRFLLSGALCGFEVACFSSRFCISLFYGLVMMLRGFAGFDWQETIS